MDIVDIDIYRREKKEKEEEEEKDWAKDSKEEDEETDWGKEKDWEKVAESSREEGWELQDSKQEKNGGG